MKAKLIESLSSIRNEHSGCTFRTSRIGISVAAQQKNDRKRNFRQWSITCINQFLMQIWKSLPPAAQAAWSLFASTFPQSCAVPVSGFLSSYQCFLRRNFFIVLNKGYDAELMLYPSIIDITDSAISFRLVRSGDALLLFYKFARNSDDLVSEIFLSRQCSEGRKFDQTFTRFMGEIINNQAIEVRFGRLYNAFAVRDVRGLAAPGWRPFTLDEAISLRESTGGLAVSGKNLMQDSGEFWSDDCVEGTNLYQFNARGCGARDRSGFIELKQIDHFYGDYLAESLQVNYNVYGFTGTGEAGAFVFLYEGHSVRFVSDNLSLNQYIGNDLQIYPVTEIGGLKWLALPLNETKFRNGDLIENVQDQAAWNALTSAAYCDYDNNALNSASSVESFIDVTERFKKNFGVLPPVGSHILLQYLNLSKNSGHSFLYKHLQLIVESS